MTTNTKVGHTPAPWLAGLKAYADGRVPPGDFLRAVLENNLMEAFGRADAENREDMFEICKYVYNEMPSACHGSPEKVRDWLDWENVVGGTK